MCRDQCVFTAWTTDIEDLGNGVQRVLLSRRCPLCGRIEESNDGEKAA